MQHKLNVASQKHMQTRSTFQTSFYRCTSPNCPPVPWTTNCVSFRTAVPEITEGAQPRHHSLHHLLSAREMGLSLTELGSLYEIKTCVLCGHAVCLSVRDIAATLSDFHENRYRSFMKKKWLNEREFCENRSSRLLKLGTYIEALRFLSTFVQFWWKFCMRGKFFRIFFLSFVKNL